jgi:hypothetical protein
VRVLEYHFLVVEGDGGDQRGKVILDLLPGGTDVLVLAQPS